MHAEATHWPFSPVVKRDALVLRHGCAQGGVEYRVQGTLHFGPRVLRSTYTR